MSAYDGRHKRGERNRARLIAATSQLVSEGVTRPSSLEIAERAKLTQKTLFNQFGAMERLYEAAGLIRCEDCKGSGWVSTEDEQ